jgi:hypothetical protein
VAKENASSQNYVLLKDTFSRTDLTIADKFHRLKHKIEGRCSYFEEQVEFRRKHPEYDQYHKNLIRFANEARHHISMLERCGNYFNYNKTVGKGENWRTRAKRAEKIQRAYQEAYDWTKDWPKRQKHIEEELGIKMPEQYANISNKNMQFILDMLEETSYLNSVEIMKARLKMEMIEAYENEWYMIFATHTVDPEHYKEVFEKGSKVWRNYIRKIQRDVQKNWPKESLEREDCFHYCAVIEEGSTTGRLHIHAMLFMKKLIPVKDPNYGLNPPILKEIDEYTWYWEYGHSNFIPIRFSNSDPYGKLGWVWPVTRGEDGNYEPIPASSIEKIAQYMTKYILKSKEKGEASWRTKTDRQMGIRTITKTLKTMKMKPLISMVKYTKQPIHIELYGHRIPTKLIRMLAVKELIKRMKLKKLRLNASEKNTTLKMLLRHGIQTKLDRNSTNIGDSLVRLFNGRDTSRINLPYYKQAREDLQEAMKASKYVTQVSGGNIDNRS